MLSQNHYLEVTTCYTDYLPWERAASDCLLFFLVSCHSLDRGDQYHSMLATTEVC